MSRRCRQERGRPVTRTDESSLLQFIVVSEAWYGTSALEGRDYVDEIVFGRFAESGGTFWEAGFRWYSTSGGLAPRARLEVFDESWGAPELPSLMAALLAETRPRARSGSEPARSWTVAEVRAVLRRQGFEDATPREDPDARH